MTYTPIVHGAPDWDVPVNNAFTDQDNRITSNTASIASNTNAINTINTSIQRLEWRPDDYNWIGWSFDPAVIQNPIASVNGTVYMQAIIIRVQTTVTNIFTNIATAGSSLTVGQNFAGIYDSSGNRLGVTADQATSWQSIGQKSMAISGGPIVVTPGKYWVTLLVNGTTPAQFWSSSSTAIIGGTGPASSLNNANARFMTGPTAQTTLPATINIGTIVSIGQTRWTALA